MDFLELMTLEYGLGHKFTLKLFNFCIASLCVKLSSSIDRQKPIIEPCDRVLALWGSLCTPIFLLSCAQKRGGKLL